MQTVTTETTETGVKAGSLLTGAEPHELQVHQTAIGAQDFILRWEAYGVSRTDAPRDFHRLHAYTLVASAIDRNRWIALAHSKVYPSVYALALAESGQRKSVALKFARAALQTAMKDRILANDYSPEALIGDLANRRPSRGTALIEEAGRILRSAKAGNYGEGLKDTFSELWDTPESVSRKLRKESFDLQSVYVNVTMALTVSRFAEMVTPEDVQSGFLARFFPVVVTEAVVRRDLALSVAATEANEAALIAWLKTQWIRLQADPHPLTVTPAALDRINDADRALGAWAKRQFQRDLVQPWATRLSEYVQRLSAIYAVSEETETVDRPQVLRAVAAVDKAKEAAVSLCDNLMQTGPARDMDKAEAFIRTNPGISGRDFLRKSRWVAAKRDSVIEALVMVGRVEVDKGVYRPVFPSPTPVPQAV